MSPQTTTGPWDDLHGPFISIPDVSTGERRDQSIEVSGTTLVGARGPVLSTVRMGWPGSVGPVVVELHAPRARVAMRARMAKERLRFMDSSLLETMSAIPSALERVPEISSTVRYGSFATHSRDLPRSSEKSEGVDQFTALERLRAAGGGSPLYISQHRQTTS